MSKLSTLVGPNTAGSAQTLYNAFARLSRYEQAVLMILAAIYKPIGSQKLGRVLSILLEKTVLPGIASDYVLSAPQKERLIAMDLLSINKHGWQVNRLICNRLTTDLVTRAQPFDGPAEQTSRDLNLAQTTDDLLQVLLAAEAVVPVIYSNHWQKKDIDKRRVIRDLFFLGELRQVQQALDFNKNPQVIDHAMNLVLVEILFLPFDFSTFITLPNRLQYHAFATLFRIFQREGQRCHYPIELLEQVCAHDGATQHPDDDLARHHLLAEQYLYQARFDDYQRIQSTHDKSSYGLQLSGTYAFLTGDSQSAVAYFESAIAAKNKFTRRKKQYLNGVLGYFYKLALMAQANLGSSDAYTQALQQVEFEEGDRTVSNDFYMLSKSVVKPILSLSSGGAYNIDIGFNSASASIDFFLHQLNYLNYLLAQIWCNQTKRAELATLAQKYEKGFDGLGYSLFAKICQQVQMANESANESRSEHTTHPRLVNLCSLITSKSQWDLALDKLIALNPSRETIDPAATEISTVRIIWELSTGYENTLQGREQKLTKSGWSKGRVIALKRLKTDAHAFTYFNDSDRKICSAIETHQGWGYYSKTDYSLQGLSALQAAVGIGNLYAVGQLDQNIELSKTEPELLVNQQGNELCLSIADLPDGLHFDESGGLDDYASADEASQRAYGSTRTNQQSYKLKPVSKRHYQLTVFSGDHLKVAKIIGEGGLLIPIEAKQKALAGIAAIAPFLNIQSDIAELDTGLKTRECDPNLVINITPNKTGLTFICVVMPFGEDGPSFKPGIGNASLSTDINGKRIATQRDLLREQALLDDLDKACPMFLQMSDNVLSLDDLQAALSALQQLEAAIEQAKLELILRWPKGKKVSLGKELDTQHLRLTVSKKSEWFDLGGDLRVNDQEVIDLRKVLELVKHTKGRFIQLGADQILTLSDDLRHRLDLIEQVSDDGSFHPLASLQVEEATSTMRMKTIHAWEQQTQKMHEANAITPQIPNTFQAQLRDYQLLGFDWASRLAHWGAGACLADDMGLGKTLQALAVMLARAKKGPSLVIAPTSVCLNWEQEALKFTPTLNIKLFADTNTTQQRQDLLGELKPFDCVIISYGLLQRESELLKQIQWHTIVADEAQALKNPLAKRTKAAYALKGDFKMITTGTPIENDLTELWSLFRFINPGLLGNLKRFGQRYSSPIENAKEDKLAAHKASQGLKTLIQPFILRRMKNQVLTELPPRTEINIQVEMSAKEQAFYEALRQNAIDNISQSGQTNAGTQRIKMLAELVKLRQACCHPKLVMPETNIPSAKLAALDELLEELKLNNHKALIFSQFVGHLQLIKQHLESKGFSYQYLDGSTPQKERQKRVNAFQDGQGDVFLISLKAGGFGLNLTAADYVIHMDPWWNPAVEQQASDRAHRMGQKRPVTIYRLIAQNTIEEKIVALHQHKRDLADKLLAGNEAANKLSVEDMLNLLQKTF